LLKVAVWGMVIGLLLSLAAPLALRPFAKEVTFVAPASREEVAVNQELWAKGEPVAPIYGIPASQPAVILFPDDSRLLRPTEDRNLLLYLVDKQRGDNPLQLKTVAFIARFAALGFGAGALVAVLALAWLRRRDNRIKATAASV
jgi:hypothetical protein